MKLQVSVEFMILVSLLLLVFIAVIGGNSYLQKNMMSIKSDTEAKKLSDKIAFEINTAVKTGDGYEKRFYIEESFAGIYYFDIEIENYSVNIRWDDKVTSSPIIVKNITGSVTKGWNLIKNTDGVINVS